MEALKVADSGVTNVLVISTDAAAGALSALRQIWSLSGVEEFNISEVAMCGGMSNVPAEVRINIARHMPSLILLCSSGELRTETAVLLKEIRDEFRETPVMLALDPTGAEGEGLTVLLNMGVADFVVAPFRWCDLIPRMRRLFPNSKEGIEITNQLKLKLGLQQLIGSSHEIVTAIDQTRKFANCDATVLLNGETGTGKEMFARAIHYLSARSNMPFIPVNCGAIPSELIENELFGHESGAFTGATVSARGLIFEAEGGTLFLDEIDSLPHSTQVKLLRFLQDKSYRPLGSRKLCRADIRVIAASNSKLENEVQMGHFRADLFFRINVLSLLLPPLRERREDIPLLARHCAAECARENQLPYKEFSPAALHKLMSYIWPGNVRELQNVIYRAILLMEGNTIHHTDIKLPGQESPVESKSFKSLKARVVQDFERTYLQQLLAEHNGNISQAARTASKNRRAFWELLRKHDIQIPSPDRVRHNRADKLRLR